MPTPPLPSRDDDEHGAPGEGEAVTLWAYRKRNGDFMYDSNKIDDLDVEMRALPVAAYNALLARANTAKVAAEKAVEAAYRDGYGDGYKDGANDEQGSDVDGAWKYSDAKAALGREGA